MIKQSLTLFFFLVITTAQAQQQEPPKNTKLRYRHYDIEFKDFQVLDLDPYAINDPTIRRKTNEYRIIFSEDTQRVIINENTDLGLYMETDGDTGINVYTDTLLKVLKDSVLIEGYYDCTFLGKPIKITPKKKSDRFKLSWSMTECVSEQINYRKIKDTALLSRLYKNALHFTYNTKFKPVPDSAHFFFRFPDYPEIDYNRYRKALMKKMHLRDTLVDLSSESDDLATVVYKNKPCHFDICNYTIKVERYSNNRLADRRYIVIVETSGD